MDLRDSPDAMKISTQSYIVKPENQADITSGTNKIIKFHIPENIAYFKPSESNFNFNIKMSGRGRPIPDRACGGFHALFRNVRTYDGTNSHLLESVDEYNTYSAQINNYTRGESLDNQKAMYAGFQASDSVTQNLYWALNSNNWTNTTSDPTAIQNGINKISIPRSVQIVSPLNTKMLSTEQFIPNAVLGGIRLELELDDYRRSLRFTTGKLGVEKEHGVVTLPNVFLGLQHQIAGNATSIGSGNNTMKQLHIATAGGGFTANKVYQFTYTSDTSTQIGFVKCTTVSGAGNAFASGEIYSIGGSTPNVSVKQPVPGDSITIVSPGGAASNAVATVLPGIFSNPYGIINNVGQTIQIPLFTGPQVLSGRKAGIMGLNEYVKAVGGALNTYSTGATEDGLAASVTPNGVFTEEDPLLGVQEDLRNPYSDHFVNPSMNPLGSTGPDATVDFNTNESFPTTNMPFDVGDSVYINQVGTGSTDANERYLGIVAGVTMYPSSAIPQVSLAAQEVRPSQFCVLHIYPDYPALTVGQDDPAKDPATLNGLNVAAFGGLGRGNFGFLGATGAGQTGGPGGGVLYTKEKDRLNGVPQNQLAHIADTALKNAASQKVDFTITDMQYQICEVSMDDSVLNADMAAANSEKGLQIDLETTHTTLTNLTPNTGPNTQLVNTGTIERALAIMSIPLLQDKQRTLVEPAFNGEVDQMVSYQWRLGIGGLVPNQPVPVEKARQGFPMLQSQYTNELMKAVESFGIPLTNLHKVLMNFAIPRSFSRPGMYYDLIKAGSLTLQTENGDMPKLGAKLFIHFINHLRSINISKNGIVIQN